MARLKKLPQIGDIVLVKANSNSHNYTIGKRYRVLAHTGMSTFMAGDLDGVWTGNNLKYKDCDPGTVDKAAIESEIQTLTGRISKLKTDIEHNQSIIAWMDETGTDTYDENEHKVWQTLTTIENESMSKMDKVRAIAALLK